jgi:2-polyprenyl-3-methyl-5-hydroxy-6-metoxy-1,4-benzoquinol methylase
MVPVSDPLAGGLSLIELAPYLWREPPDTLVRKRLWLCGSLARRPGSPRGGFSRSRATGNTRQSSEPADINHTTAARFDGEDRTPKTSHQSSVDTHWEQDLTPQLTERQKRERDYYDQYSGMVERGVDFAPIEGSERRPWNSYWRLFELIQDAFRPGARLLDFGCGWGTNTVVFTRIGYQVEGFDISQQNVLATMDLARKHGVADRVNASMQAAEALTFPDNHFDVVAGVDILHHVEVGPAMRECHRVLKPGGKAFFREPLYSALFDPVRNWGPVRRVVPNCRSFERHITDDERKLDSHDLGAVRAVFPNCHVEHSRIMARLAVLAPSLHTSLEKADRLIAKVPGAHLASGTGIIIVTKPV